MKNTPIKSKKTKLIESINKTWASAQSHSKNAMEDAIKTGGMLCELKQLTPHGKWIETLSNTNFWVVFEERQAQKLMNMFDKKHLLKLVAGDEILSINASQEAIKNATEEQKAEAEKLAEQERLLEIDKAEKKKLDEKKKRERNAPEPTKNDPDIIDGEFTEVSSEEPAKYVPIVEKEEPRKTELDELQEMLDETFFNNKILIDENASLVKILESNDQISDAVKEAKKLHDEVAFLKALINQLMHESNAAKNAAKMWKSKYKKLEKEIKK